MNFYILSDVHCEYLEFDDISKIINKIKSSKCIINSTNPIWTSSILLMAGDIGNLSTEEQYNKLKFFMYNIAPYFTKIIWIFGNHEYYNLSLYDARLVGYKLNSELNQIYNNKFVLLINDIYEINGYTILGTTLWSYALNSENTTNCIGMVHDFKSHNEYNEEHLKDVTWLTYMLNIFKNNNKNIIVMTHHLPSYQCILPKYRIYDKINSYFASNLDHLIMPNIKAWIYGHTHTADEKNINGVNLYCNPLGYKTESKQKLKQSSILKMIIFDINYLSVLNTIEENNYINEQYNIDKILSLIDDDESDNIYIK